MLSIYSLNSVNEIPLAGGFIALVQTILGNYATLTTTPTNSFMYTSANDDLVTNLNTLYTTYGTHILHTFQTGAQRTSQAPRCV